MDTIEKTSRLHGKLMEHGFYVVSSELSPDGYNQQFTINCDTPNLEHELNAILEEEGWMFAMSRYESTPHDSDTPIESFQPYYWARAETPDIFHRDPL